jgi:predicted solute-binding protein
MTPLLPIYRKHCESIGQESFLRIPLGRSWRRLTMTPLVFAVLVLLLAGCASNRHLQQQQHSSDTPFFDTPDVDSLH